MWKTACQLAEQNRAGLKQGKYVETFNILREWDANSTHTAVLEEWKNEEKTKKSSPGGGERGDGGDRVVLGARIGGGGYKTVHKAHWFGKELAVALVKNLSVAQKNEFEHEVRLEPNPNRKKKNPEPEL